MRNTLRPGLLFVLGSDRGNALNSHRIRPKKGCFHTLECPFHPRNGHSKFVYAQGALMAAQIYPRGSRFEHESDDNGRVTTVRDPEGGSLTYGLAEVNGAWRLSATSAEGERTTYEDVENTYCFASTIVGPDNHPPPGQLHRPLRLLRQQQRHFRLDAHRIFTREGKTNIYVFVIDIIIFKYF